MSIFRAPRKPKLLVKLLIIVATLILATGYLISNTFAEEGKVVTVAEGTSASKGSSSTLLYRQDCARCHGADGKGETPMGQALGAPDFTDPDWQKDQSTKDLTRVVTRGKKGMPAFNKKLTKREISSLVSYVRRFKKS
jgi:mono/diheme cytochrome c family protein